MDASPIVSFEANIGLEMVWNGASSELSAFGVLGGDVSVGPQDGFASWGGRAISGKGIQGPISTGYGLYYANIHNVNDTIQDYSGPVVYNSTTLSPGYGFTIGTSHLDETKWGKKPYSHVIGGNMGWSATKNAGGSYYFPITSYSSQHGLRALPNMQTHIQGFGNMLSPQKKTNPYGGSKKR